MKPALRWIVVTLVLIVCWLVWCISRINPEE